ncbi:MAG: autotransporter-associated beta strand repeat-containing protein [Verrucomicrobiota bacterium]
MGTPGVVAFQPNVNGTYSVRGVDFLSGAGAFVFSGTNSGKLIVGASGVVNNSASLQTFGSSITLGLGAAASFQVNAAGGMTIDGAVTAGSHALTLRGNGAGIGQILGPISGTGGLIKDGASTWILSGTNTYSGGTTVKAGLLRVTTAQALGAAGLTILRGGTLEFAAAVPTDFSLQAIQVQTSSTIQSGALFSGGSAMHSMGSMKIGDATLTVAPGINSGGSASISTSSVTLEGNATLQVQAGASATFGSVSETGGSRNFTKTGAGALIFSGTSSLTGILQLNAGSLSVLNTGTLGSSSLRLVVNGGSLSLANASQTIGSLSGTGGSINLSGHSLTIAQSGSTSFSGSFSGSGSMVFSGGGSVTLSGGGSVAGGLQISAASSVRLGANNGIPNYSQITFNSGTFAGNGFSYTTAAGVQVLPGGGTFDFGTGAGSSLAFGDSSSLPWNGSLKLVNFTPGVDSLRFGNNAAGLTPTQLALIEFTGSGAVATIDANGYVTASAIPEPADFAMAFGGLALVVALRRRWAKARA